MTVSARSAADLRRQPSWCHRDSGRQMNQDDVALVQERLMQRRILNFNVSKSATHPMIAPCHNKSLAGNVFGGCSSLA
eukprot:1840696-Amphidinium_carterae.1